MGVIRRISAPKTSRGKKFLQSREPKYKENPKRTIFIRGGRASQTIVDCMRDFCRLRKPHGTFMNRKNDWHPFEDSSKIEFFGRKYDASLFMFGSHSKKRPNNLTIGRLYDGHLLDMFELGINNLKTLSHFKNEKIPLGTKPCLLFCGDDFEYNYDLQRLQNLLIDMFQFEKMQYVRLKGLEHVLMFTAAKEVVYLRSYRIMLKKSGGRTPRVELEEIGPSLDFTIRRTKLASQDLFTKSLKKPKALRVKTVKNISTDNLGSTHGRIHIPKQNINKLQTRKMKGLKKTPAERKALRKEKAAKKKPDIGVKRGAPTKKRTARAGKRRKVDAK